MNLRTSTFGLALLLACAPKGDHGSIEIFQACSPPAPDTTTGGCVYETGSCSKTPLDMFAFDVSGAGATPRVMFVGFEVHNQLKANATSDGAANTHDATVEGYTVSYSGISARQTDVRINQVVPASGSAVVGVRLVDTSSAEDMLANLGASGYLRVVANLQIFGHLHDGSSFETPVQPYSIEVCNGCMSVPTCPDGSAAKTCPESGQYPLSVACGS